MRHFASSVVFALFLGLVAFSVQAAEQATVPEATIAQPSLLKTGPGLSLLPTLKDAAQPVAAPRIGVVDINKVSSESFLGKAAQHKIKAQQTKLQKQIEAKRKQLDKFKADTERQLPGLSPQQREAKSKEFQKRVAVFQKFGMNAEKELMDSQQKLMKELFEAIGQAAEELGKSKGVAAIVINRELLFVGAGVEPLDLTADLVKLLNDKEKK